MTREMKNSGVQWIGDIPSNWGVKRFRYLHERANVGETIGKDFWSIDDSNFVFYTAGERYIFCTYRDFPKWKLVGENDLLLSRNGTPYVYLPIINALYTDHIIRVPIKTQIYDKRYVRYSLQRSIEAEKVDVVMLATWSVSLWNEQRVPIPPLSEQKAIADFLDAKCGEIDGLLSDLDAEVKTLAEYKKSLIAETVTRGLNPNAPMKQSGIPWADTIPAHWAIDKGKFRFELRRTKGNTRNLVLLSPTQKYGVIPQSQLEGVVLVKENTDLNSFRTIHKGDFCISLRSFQGGFEYSNYEGVVSPAYQVFYPIKPIADGYYKYIFKSDGFISYINTFSMSLRDGKNIAFEDFGNSNIPVPPMEEQVAIADFLDTKCAAIDQAITDKTTQIETLKAYKASLIYEYVTGKKQVAL